MDELRDPTSLTRRRLLGGSGALIMSFSLLGVARGQGDPDTTAATPSQEPAKLPGALDTDRMLDSWIRIDADGRVTVFTGKAELGQGVKTAILQCAAEELEV